jgi:hypothetical protein
MLSSPRIGQALAAAGLLLLLLLCAASADAAAAASVTVRVEGVNQTLLAPTSVTTNGTPVEKDGNPEHTCKGGSAAGALEQATSGNWGGSWFEIGYSVETILGETHAFEVGAPANYFWGYWLDNKASEVGICEGELSPGDSILLFPECFSESEPSPCPASPNPLGIAAPQIAEPGTPITVAVTSYANASGAPSPAIGVSVTGGGASATTDATGHATLTFSETGNVLLRVSAPGSVRSEAPVCVHRGNDGNCGTTAPAGTTTAASTAAPSAPYKGPYAVVAKAAGVLDGHVYPAKRAPRLLRGTVTAHTSLASVSLRLRRSYRGRCFAYDGKSTRFARSRCGQGSFFKVATSSSFSYLLPSALAPGRYVLDIEATDAAGNSTSLARGSSRIVFYVG